MDVSLCATSDIIYGKKTFIDQYRRYRIWASVSYSLGYSKYIVRVEPNKTNVLPLWCLSSLQACLSPLGTTRKSPERFKDKIRVKIDSWASGSIILLGRFWIKRMYIMTRLKAECYCLKDLSQYVIARQIQNKIHVNRDSRATVVYYCPTGFKLNACRISWLQMCGSPLPPDELKIL